MHIQSPNIVNNLFKHFQGYLGIFMDIEAYSATLTDTQLRGRGKVSPALLRIEISVLIFKRF